MDKKEYLKEYYKRNKVRFKERNEARADERKEYDRLYWINNKETKLKWRKNNEVKLKEYRSTYNKTYNKERRDNDPLFKLRTNIASLIRYGIKKNGYTKLSKTFEILGCTYLELKEHLEKQWQPWMSWDNYGIYTAEINVGWDIDHITPTSSAATEGELIKLNHYTNLQPLCSKINRDVKKDNPLFILN